METDFQKQRKAMVERYKTRGYLHSKKMVEAMRKVPREAFMPCAYLEYAYYDQPFPIPGDGQQTISAPYTYAMFYEPLHLTRGDRILEVGTGSGYGAALARELVGNTGKVVTIEVNTITYCFGKRNLEKVGYHDVIMICDDGSKGYPPEAPYDKICVTAACPEIPAPLTKQVRTPGRIVAPVGGPFSLIGQNLVLLSKDKNGETTMETLDRVVYVPLTGEYGWK
jgi:protein-L-isoaspartate(D-aspartate) O-methyltransferase